MEYTTVTISRDGQKDLEFEGIELASSSDWKQQGPNNSRFSRFGLYRTEGGKYVIHRENISHWAGEENDSIAEIFDSAAALVADGENEYGGYADTFKALILEAAEKDEAFKGLMTERLE